MNGFQQFLCEVFPSEEKRGVLLTECEQSPVGADNGCVCETILQCGDGPERYFSCLSFSEQCFGHLVFVIGREENGASGRKRIRFHSSVQFAHYGFHGSHRPAGHV